MNNIYKANVTLVTNNGFIIDVNNIESINRATPSQGFNYISTNNGHTYKISEACTLLSSDLYNYWNQS